MDDTISYGFTLSLSMDAPRTTLSRFILLRVYLKEGSTYCHVRGMAPLSSSWSSGRAHESPRTTAANISSRVLIQTFDAVQLFIRLSRRYPVNAASELCINMDIEAQTLITLSTVT